MTIEEIEKEWEKVVWVHKDGHSIDDILAEFALDYVSKLLAVVKAAKEHIENCEDAGITDGSLQKSLEDLEKE